MKKGWIIAGVLLLGGVGIGAYLLWKRSRARERAIRAVSGMLVAPHPKGIQAAQQMAENQPTQAAVVQQTVSTPAGGRSIEIIPQKVEPIEPQPAVSVGREEITPFQPAVTPPPSLVEGTRPLSLAEQDYVNQTRQLREAWKNELRALNQPELTRLIETPKLSDREAILKTLPMISDDEVREMMKGIPTVPTQVVVELPGFKIEIFLWQDYERYHELAIVLGAPTLRQWLSLSKHYGVPLPAQLPPTVSIDDPASWDFSSLYTSRERLTVSPGTRIRFAWDVSGGGKILGDAVVILAGEGAGWGYYTTPEGKIQIFKLPPEALEKVKQNQPVDVTQYIVT